MKWLWRILIFLLLFAIGAAMTWLLAGCCPRIARANVTAYQIGKGKCVYTPAGACVIPNDNTVDEALLAEVDRKIVETEKCVYEHFPKYKRNVKQSCYVVYIPNDIRVACQDKEQFVFGKAPLEACEAKGFGPKEDCPCGWRVAVQDGQYIITEPHLYLFRAGVAELITGWRQVDIWQSPEMVGCIGF